MVMGLYFNPIFSITYETLRESNSYYPDIEEFKDPKITKVENKSNVVWIYLESFERTFLNESIFPGLVPNLKKLESESLTFLNVKQLPGTEWTIAGMVASQCGAPLTIPYSGDDWNYQLFFAADFLPGMTCMGDILNTLGYHTVFMGGANLEFGGKGNFYKTHKFTETLGLQEQISLQEDKKYISSWGLYDDQLYKNAENKIIQLEKSKKSYAFVLHTLDTHGPDGYLSKSCSNIKYKNGDNKYLNAIHCSDKLISKFINNIKGIINKDTLIVISSDHLAMKNSASNKINHLDRNNLFILNHKTNIIPEKSNKNGSIIDMGATILDYLDTGIYELGLGRSLKRSTKTFVESYHNPSKEIRKLYPEFRKYWKIPPKIEYLNIDPKNHTVNLRTVSLRLPISFILNKENYILEDHIEKFSPQVIEEFDKQKKLIWIDYCLIMKDKITNIKFNEYKTQYCLYDSTKKEIYNISKYLKYQLEKK